MFEHTDQQVHFALVRNGYDPPPGRLGRGRPATDGRRRPVPGSRRRSPAWRRSRIGPERSRAKISVLGGPFPRGARRTRRTRGRPGAERAAADRQRGGPRSALPGSLPGTVGTEAIERMTSDVSKIARFRAARIIGSARRDQEEADRLRRRIPQTGRRVCRRGPGARPTGRAQAVWDNARESLHSAHAGGGGDQEAGSGQAPRAPAVGGTCGTSGGERRHGTPGPPRRRLRRGRRIA